MFHIVFIFIAVFGWIYEPYFLLLSFFVIISWYLNKNNCLFTQLEYKLFGKTIINNNKFRVPFRHRFILYLSFCLGLFCNIIYPYIRIL